MSGAVVRKRHVPTNRVHDYLYDPAFIVTGARDYARATFKAAMSSGQFTMQPIFKTMFSELKRFPRMRVVMHGNCRLPDHMDRSYQGYLVRLEHSKLSSVPDFSGKDLQKFTACPKKVLNVNPVTPEFHPPSPAPMALGPTRPRHRGTQSLFRESSAQTVPWQPDGAPASTNKDVPEVMYLDKLEWGPGDPYRKGDLPADFHTTQIINKLRHARIWTAIAEQGEFPRWMKKRDNIIHDIETKDWIFREAEIDELQSIRLELLHRMQREDREKSRNKTSQKLCKLWAWKKQEMERKVDLIRRTRDRELRKLTAMHMGGGRQGLVQKLRSARGGGSRILAASDPASNLHAPIARFGYQANVKHKEIVYDPSLLQLEDHYEISRPPAWLEQCGKNLKKSCSGHDLPRDTNKLCERETKWSEQFLENLHNDLKKARHGAAATTGPLHVLKPRRLADTPRPRTPEVDPVPDADEADYQAALVMQRIIRGRAVQSLMYEGRTRASELTEELKTTHGLQKEDRIQIAHEEARAREYNVLKTEADQREDAITALVDELCGGAVSAALDFLEKELRRLKEERRQHAFILIAMREKQMREAAEAGRRQKEEHRRREHDEMFKQVLGVTQETVDAYLDTIVQEGVELAAESMAISAAEKKAEQVDLHYGVPDDQLTSAEQNELVAELVQQFLLPEAHKMAARHHIASVQKAKLEAARMAIFGLLDDAEIKDPYCIRCGCPLDELCRCRTCPLDPALMESPYKDDPRWKYTRKQGDDTEKPIGERFPPQHDFRCMMNQLVDEVVLEARRLRSERQDATRELGGELKERVEVEIEARNLTEHVFNLAMGVISVPEKTAAYRHYMYRYRDDAMERTVPAYKPPCPYELPSEMRRKMEAGLKKDTRCSCKDKPVEGRVRIRSVAEPSPSELKLMLPSELRAWEELKTCKCDQPSSVTSDDVIPADPAPSAGTSASSGPMGEYTPHDFTDDEEAQ